MRKLGILMSIYLLISGCNWLTNDYQIITHDNTVYRLNTRTGELIIINNDKSIEKYCNDYIKDVFSDKSQVIRIKNASFSYSPFNELKSYKDYFPGSSKQMWTLLKYKWRNNEILFNYEFGPYSEELDKIIEKRFRKDPPITEEDIFDRIFPEKLTLHFIDEDGFDITSIIIELQDFLRIYDENGQIHHWKCDGSLECSLIDYIAISGYEISWSLGKVFKKALHSYSNELKLKNESSPKYPKTAEEFLKEEGFE